MNTTSTSTDDGAVRRNDKFDIERSTCILPAKTSVLAYVDDHGNLWIYGSDAGRCCDTELRIAADDVLDFIDGLTELIGIPAVGNDRQPQPRPSKTSNAERQRRYRNNRRSKGGAVTRNVTRNAQTVTRDVTQGGLALTGGSS
jgi:hypothetical protein